jgi:hypothetical protein
VLKNNFLPWNVSIMSLSSSHLPVRRGLKDLPFDSRFCTLHPPSFFAHGNIFIDKGSRCKYKV